MWEDEIRVLDDQKGGTENGWSFQNTGGVHSMNQDGVAPHCNGSVSGLL